MKISKEPVSILGFTHNYRKLQDNQGTTIRIGLKDKSGYKRKEGDIVWLSHSNIRFKAIITMIEHKEIRDIDLNVLKKDISPFPCNSHQDFIHLISKFYNFLISEYKEVYVIYWERIT